MTTDNHTDTTDSSDESAVIKALRSQIKDLEKDIKARPDRETVEADIRSQLERESAIAEQLVTLGHPKGMSAIVAGKLGEGEITPEGVATALTTLGYEVKLEDTSEKSDDSSTPDEASQALADVASLSSQVSSAAQNAPTDDTARLIAEAPDREALAQVMADKGMTAQYT